jgi:hypothetical protein
MGGGGGGPGSTQAISMVRASKQSASPVTVRLKFMKASFSEIMGPSPCRFKREAHLFVSLIQANPQARPQKAIYHAPGLPGDVALLEYQTDFAS